MSGLNAEEVRVALTGHVYYIPPGKTYPTDMSPVTDGVDLGYTTEDGVAFSFAKDTEDIMGWQTKDPLRKLVTAEPKSCSFSLRQLSRDTWLSTMGGTITKNADDSYLWEPDEGKQLEGAIIVEFVDGAKSARFGFRRAAQTAAVEFNLVRNDAINLPNEWTALATSDGSKASFAVFNDDAFAATTAYPDPPAGP